MLESLFNKAAVPTTCKINENSDTGASREIYKLSEFTNS